MTSLNLAPERGGRRRAVAHKGLADYEVIACEAGHSVLCAPIVDPVRERTVAVFYLQNEGLKNAFGEADWAWMHTYARTLGRALAAGLRSGGQ